MIREIAFVPEEDMRKASKSTLTAAILRRFKAVISGSMAAATSAAETSLTVDEGSLLGCATNPPCVAQVPLYIVGVYTLCAHRGRFAFRGSRARHSFP